MPSNREDLLEAVTEAARSGVIVLVVTQCAHGGVSGDYETGQALLDAGAIPGSDITQVSCATGIHQRYACKYCCISFIIELIQIAPVAPTSNETF